jgi:hypothetical protein
MYPSEWLKFDWLIDGDQTLTITKIDQTVFKDMKTGEEKPQIVLFFTETKLKLGLGAGNARTLAKVFGDDSDDWIGKKIMVGCATANNGTDYVQVREKPTIAANRAKKAPAFPGASDRNPGALGTRSSKPAEPVTQEEADEGDEIPF